MGGSVSKQSPQPDDVDVVFNVLDEHVNQEFTNIVLQYVGTSRYTLNLANSIKDPTIKQIAFGHYEVSQQHVVFFGYLRRFNFVQQANITWSPETVQVMQSSCGYSIPPVEKQEQLRTAFFKQFDMMRKYDKATTADARFKVDILNRIDNDLFTKVTICDTTDIGFKLYKAQPMRFI